MKKLHKYIIKNNFAILFPTLLISVGIFLLVDIFERLDVFTDTSCPSSTIIIYFLAKTPTVISQILPAVFLLSCVIQLSLMSKSRELLAVWAGGISNLSILITLILCAFFWSGVQLSFSQYVGVKSDIYASKIWDEQIKKKESLVKRITNVWFVENNSIINIQELYSNGEGKDFASYELSADGLNIDKIIRAKKLNFQNKNLYLSEVNIIEPQLYTSQNQEKLEMQVKQNIEFLFASEYGLNQLPIWSLSTAIKQLESSGSNVEALKTSWHTRLAYAFSLVVMAVISLAIVSYRNNVYLASALAILITFIFYTAFTMSGSLGNVGILSPLIAAWITNIIAFCLAGIRIIYIL